MNEDPIAIVLMIAVSFYVLYLWLHDYVADRAGRPNPHALPGATSAPLKASVIAVAGTLVILAAETWGEIRLGLSDQQSKITVLFGVHSLLAAFVEELIFRGFVVVDGKGKVLRWAGILGASVLFSVIHPFLWNLDNWVFTWTLTAKGWFSMAAVFLGSLWFYTVRFAAFNPNHSLIPCIAAHASKNLGVFAIKATQGFVVGLL
ncbi:MAG: CPBP family intramembrane glutamic endopeptidase [Opitutaceae bacterium]|jgi:hypothetical protein